MQRVFGTGAIATTVVVGSDTAYRVVRGDSVLGFAVVRDPVPMKTLSTPGLYYWGGVASTAFWVDPAEELTALFFTQLLPSSTYPIRPQLRQLIYAALVD